MDHYPSHQALSHEPLGAPDTTPWIAQLSDDGQDSDNMSLVNVEDSDDAQPWLLHLNQLLNQILHGGRFTISQLIQ